jgi:hypothetical protein
MNISEHFTLEEFTFSETGSRLGLNNTPPPLILLNLKQIAAFMEKVRTLLGKPIVVHSGYRSPQVNRAVGGVPTSAHCNGLACDFTCPEFGTPYQVAKKIQEYAIGLSFDQIIREYGWVHAGLGAYGVPWRNEFLTKRSASAPYERGILD